MCVSEYFVHACAWIDVIDWQARYFKKIYIIIQSNVCHAARHCTHIDTGAPAYPNFYHKNQIINKCQLSVSFFFFLFFLYVLHNVMVERLCASFVRFILFYSILFSSVLFEWMVYEKLSFWRKLLYNNLNWYVYVQRQPRKTPSKQWFIAVLLLLSLVPFPLCRTHVD